VRAIEIRWLPTVAAYNHHPMSYASTADDLRRHLATQIALGWYPEHGLVEEAAALFATTAADVRPLIAELSRERAQQMASWPPTTDCDRLDAAFAALDQVGIRARQHLACCTTCGVREMHGHVHLARAMGARIEGYVFYARQDAELAVETGELPLCHGTISDDRDANRAIGERIVAALREQGLHPVWDDDVIVVRDVRWQRRAWPADGATSAWTPEVALVTWTKELGPRSAADFARSLDRRAVQAAVELGLTELARALAHASVGTGPTATVQRLSFIAELLGSAELWREAFARVPFGAYDELVELMLVAPLDAPALRKIARLRVLEARPDFAGAAALAWYIARTADDDALLADVQRVRADTTRTRSDEMCAFAIDAALWVILARRGETSEAAAKRALVRSQPVYLEDPPFPRNAAIVAARLLGDEELLATLGAQSREPSTLAAAEAERVRESSGVGLSVSGDVERAELDVFWTTFRHADRAGKVRQLFADVQRVRDAIASCGDRVRARLERVRDGGRLEAFAVDEQWLAEEADGTLERAIQTWTSATDRWTARDAGTAILEAAAAFARRGDLARARELTALVLGTAEDPVVDGRAAAITCLALGDLDRAIEITQLEHERAAVAPVIVALAQAGRTRDALDLLEHALRSASDRARLVELGPAIVAVSVDPRAAAGALLDAWAAADAHLDRLLPPPS